MKSSGMTREILLLSYMTLLQLVLSESDNIYYALYLACHIHWHHAVFKFIPMIEAVRCM